MPMTAAASITAMGALPVTNVASGSGEGGDPVVHVTLKFRTTLAFNPATLMSALTTQYGAAKVSLTTDQINPLGPFEFDIAP